MNVCVYVCVGLPVCELYCVSLDGREAVKKTALLKTLVTRRRTAIVGEVDFCLTLLNLRTALMWLQQVFVRNTTLSDTQGGIVDLG